MGIELAGKKAAASWVLRARIPGVCLIAALCCLGAVPLQAGELGAFFTRTAIPAYEQGPRRGPKIALRPRMAYAVIGTAWDSSERMWLRLRMPEVQHSVRGEGWTPLTAKELAARGASTVDIYGGPVEPGQPSPTVTQVPAAEVIAAGEGVPGKSFPQVLWRPVRYTTKLAAQPWVAATAGIYRPARSPAFLMGVYQELQQRKVAPEGQRRLLAGVVRPGDSAQEVRWAWGDPLRTWQEGQEGKRRTVWGYAEGQLRFDGDTVKDVR